MKRNLMLLLVIFTMVVSFAGMAGAQDVDPNCFNLAGTADCELLQGAIANTEANLTSFNMNFAIDATVTGLAALQPGIGDITFSVAGEGPFVFTGEGQAPFAMALDMTVNANDGTNTIETPASFAIVDDVVYFQNPEDGAWMGMSIEDAMSASGGAGLPVDPSALAGGEIPGVDDEMMGQLMGVLLPIVTAVPNYGGYERGADVDGLAVFTYTLDLSGLLQDEAVAAAITEALAAAAEENPMLGMVPMLLPGFGGDVTVTRYVDAESNFVVGLDFGLNLTLDLNAMVPSSSEAPSLDPVAITLDFQVELSELNSAVAPVAPEGATMMEAGS